MKLEGIHHITAITGDAPSNVAFYTAVLGLRMVKKTVNQDDPTVYHLFYGDEHGSPGADLTFFEYPGAPAGRAGAGMVHRILWRVSGEAALDFWARRLSAQGVWCERAQSGLRFADPEGLEHELLIASSDDAPLIAEAPDVPRELALQGFEGVRSYSVEPARSEQLLAETLGLASGEGGRWEARGERRGGFYIHDPAPDSPPLSAAGTVHHVAFASQTADHAAWRERIALAGFKPTPVIDRFYFQSIYFREPSGVLMEIATLGPGFAVDEDPEHLGEHLSLPPRLEPSRARLEQLLTPLPNPRSPDHGVI
jgi:glyoxalase family protein